MSADPLTTSAPDAAGALERVVAAAWSAADRMEMGDLCELVARNCAGQLGLEPLTTEPARGARWHGEEATDWRGFIDLSTTEATVCEFAEQFTVDVASVTPELRRRLSERLGADAATVVAMIFVMDFVPRTRAVFAAVVPTLAADAVGLGAPPAGPDLWEALDEFTRTVATLDALEPVVTELVRLRGAREHRCRLCASLRSRPALKAGADEATFAAADHGDTAQLSPAQNAALALTDAMIWTPASVPPEVVTALGAEFSEEQRVELVLDVTRNALNKVAVGLGADKPHVEDGLEIYDIDGDGNLVYGVGLD